MSTRPPKPPPPPQGAGNGADPETIAMKKYNDKHGQAGGPDQAVIAMQEFNADIEDEENMNLVQETDIEMSCTENIYNAFLLLKYRSEPDIQRARERSSMVVNSLGCVAYLIAVFQWVALAMLIAVTRWGYIDDEGELKANLDDLRGWKEQGDRPLMTFFLFPFFMFAVLCTFREGKKSSLDIRVLKEMGITLWSARCCCCLPHVILLKMLTEQAFAWVGSLVYLLVLVIFTQNAPEWNQYDNLAVILNLLAYETVLSADEYIYEVFKPFVVEYMVQNGIQTPLFEGRYKKQGGYSVWDKSKFVYWMTLAVLYTSVVQAVWSRRYAFVVVVVVVWFCFVLLPWCFFARKAKKQ